MQDFDRQLAFEVRARALELQSNRQEVTTAEAEIRAAADAERVVGERYKAGVATSTDVLDAQLARLQAELDRLRALAGVRIAEARLERAAAFRLDGADVAQLNNDGPLAEGVAALVALLLQNRA